MKPSTAKHGNPKEATRGAGYRRAKHEFESLWIKTENDLSIALDAVMNCDPAECSTKLQSATPGDYTEWTRRLRQLMEAVK